MLQKSLFKSTWNGISKGINFNEIIILNEKNGKPFIKLLNKTKFNVEKRLKRKNIRFLYLFLMKIIMQLLLLLSLYEYQKIILDNIKTLLGALIIAILLRSLVIQPFYIPSSSMEPTLLVGDRIL